MKRFLQLINERTAPIPYAQASHLVKARRHEKVSALHQKLAHIYAAKGDHKGAQRHLHMAHVHADTAGAHRTLHTANSYHKKMMRGRPN